MALDHSTAAENAATNAVVDLLDVGSGSNGTLVIKDGSNNVLATINLPNPAFGDSSNGTATANAITQQNATGAGTAAVFEARDANGDVVFSGSVTATGGGGDMELVNTSIAVNQPIAITSWTYKALQD